MPRKKSTAPEPLEGLEEEQRTRPFWSGTISFGLVTIPVELYAATRSTRSSLRMIGPSGTPVVRRYFDERGKALEPSELQRGYALDDETFVLVSDEELERLAPAQSRDIDLTRFVATDAISPLLFERSYILAPAGNSNLAYRLLASTLDHMKRAGIASFIMRGKQHVVAIVSERGLLRAHTLHFGEEVRTPETIGLPTAKAAPPLRVKALRTAIDRTTVTKPPLNELRDDYWQRLETLVERKRKRGEDVVTPEPVEGEGEQLAEVIDLVAVLRKSLGQGRADEGKPGGERAAERAEAPERERKSVSAGQAASAPRSARTRTRTSGRTKRPRARSAGRTRPGGTSKRSATTKKKPRNAPTKRAGSAAARGR